MGNNKTGDKTPPPLWVSPLSCKKLNHEETAPPSDGSYGIIQQLFTPPPDLGLPDAEIETVLEGYTTSQGCLWRRVSVWSGSTTRRLMQASFILPNESRHDLGTGSMPHQPPPTEEARPEEQSLLCWAAFPERPNHKFLCVLASPSMLTIWDVFPIADNSCDGVHISAEGHSVSLPFSCSSIYPLGDSQGILLERKQDQDDLDARTASEYQDIDIPKPEFEDELFLKVPFRHARTNGMQTEHNEDTVSHSYRGAPSPRTAYTVSPCEVPSLFSMSHPLADILPVALFSQDKPSQRNFTDVFERIIYSSTIRWTEQHNHPPARKEYRQPICVTYNTIRKRYVKQFW